MLYNHIEIEERWQRNWSDNKVNKASIDFNKPKYYVLDMFPYPSGSGLHIGHPLGYIASDIISRYKRMCAFNVLHPIGYDSFGLPTEQYAIATGQHPIDVTNTNIRGGQDIYDNNIIGYDNQLKRLGLSYDYDREIITSDPSYYKWSQFIFNRLFNSYFDTNLNKSMPIDLLVEYFNNNGSLDNTAFTHFNYTISFTKDEWKQFSIEHKDSILMNYRLLYLDNTYVNWCEELGTVLANDEVIDGVSERGGYKVTKRMMKQWMLRLTSYSQRLLDGLDDLEWSDSIKEIQRNWIGRKHGYEICFETNYNSIIKVLISDIDELDKFSCIIISIDHPLIELLKDDTVYEYKGLFSDKTDIDRLSSELDGVLTDIKVKIPDCDEYINVYVSGSILMNDGYGAIICSSKKGDRFNEFNNVNSLSDSLTIKDINKSDKVVYRLKDVAFSRQRYWGEPIPIYYDNGRPILIDSDMYPIVLPDLIDFKNTDTDSAPLSKSDKWAWDSKNKCITYNTLIDNINIFPMECNTMPGWIGSSWYYLRYMDPYNDSEMFSKESELYWGKVDLYVGGIEHSTGHLIYSRFLNKFLYDLGYVSNDEYSVKLVNQGMILGNSAFVYRVNDTNKYVSYGLKDNYNVTPIRVDISLLDNDNILDINLFKKWRSEYMDAEFILEGGVYITGREIEKMSKSKYNTISPDYICDKYGADTLRIYEMFLGPIQQSKAWNDSSLTGAYNFIKRIWSIFTNENGFIHLDDSNIDIEMRISINKLIVKVKKDLDKMSFNTIISSLMILTNEIIRSSCKDPYVLERLILILYPLAPHISEELWCGIGKSITISDMCNETVISIFPEEDLNYMNFMTYDYPISINDKFKFKLSIDCGLDVNDIESYVLSNERVINILGELKPIRVIVIKNKVVNILI